VSDWTVPGYADVRELGHTGSGRTVLGRHVATDVPVLIAYLSDDLRRDDAYLNRYRARARAFADIQSPHVAGLYEYVEASAGVAVVREYVDGVSLRAILTARGGLRPEAALSVLKGGLAGLAAAHELGVSHGAVSADTIMVDTAGHPKVSGWSLVGSEAGPAADVTAAVAVYVEAAGKVPKKLRGLVRAEPADASALLGELEVAARAAHGSDWLERGRTHLAQQAARSRPRGRRG
jgi:eukaryotic-like serine/threonine-protein kinase